MWRHSSTGRNLQPKVALKILFAYDYDNRNVIEVVCMFKYDPCVIILQSSKILHMTYNPTALNDDKYVS
jgi:hypothetical protein